MPVAIARASRRAARTRFARHQRRGAALVAAVASLTAAKVVNADLQNFTFTATDNATIQPAGPRSGANGKNFWNIEADGNGTNASYGVIDFGSINIGNNQVNSLNSISVDLFDAPSAFSSTNNVVVDFYLVTSTNDASVATSSLKYVSGKTPQGGFATALTSAVLLGSGTYASTGSNGSHFGYNLSTASITGAANTYVLNQLNNFGSLRLVATLEAASGTGAAATFAGFSSNAVPTDPTFTTAAPKLNLGLDVTALPNNDSVITITNATDTAHVGFDLGRVIRNAASGTVAVTVANTGTSSANTLLNNSNTVSSVTAGSLPLKGGGTTTVTVGLSAAATAGPAGISGASGSLMIQDVSNANAPQLQVDLSGSIIESRLLRNVELETGSTVANLGRILVGTTVTNRITVSTQNNVGDFSTNTLTHTQISATATASFTASSSSPYNMSGTNVGGAVDWTGTGTQRATFQLTVTPTKSFATGVGSNAAFLRFTNTNGISGEGLTNENDQINLYSQFTAYAPAVLTGATNAATATNGTFSLGNAGGDNGTASLSLRLGGRITSSSILAQGGFTFGGTSTLAAGNVIAGATTNTATYSFDKTGKLNGLYKGTYTYSAENDDQTVIGTKPGDVATNKTITFAATVTGNSGSGTANLLPGGSYAGYSIGNNAGSNTTVAFLAGTSTAGANPTVNFSTSLSTRAAGDHGIITGTGTDKFVVQYSYSSNVTASGIGLAVFNGTNYVGSGYKNSDGLLGTEVKGAFDGNVTLGRYGIDTTNRVVWAVVDRPGTFVPYVRAAGDVNFDGQIDKNDIRSLATSGFYNDGLTSHTFAEGDFNGDGTFDKNDVRLVATAPYYNAGPYDPVALPGPAAGPVTLTSAARSASASGSVAAATTPITYNYNPTTGDVTVSLNGNATVVEVDLISATNKFLTAGSKLQSGGLTFVTNSTHEQDGFSNFGSFIADGFDLGTILPAGLTLAQLQSDLTAQYSVSGNSNYVAANIAVPEPVSLSLLALGSAGLLARRRRRRA